MIQPYVVVLHPCMQQEVERIMADPNPQGYDALTRAALNGCDVVYMSDSVRFTDMQIVRSNPCLLYTSPSPRD